MTTDNVLVPRELLRSCLSIARARCEQTDYGDASARATLDWLLHAVALTASEAVVLPLVPRLADEITPRHPLIADGFRAGAHWMRRQIEALGPLYAHPPAPAVPEGWQLVPLEPTPEMLSATTTSRNPALRAEVMRMAAEDWAKMLAAGPPHQ